MKKNLFVVHFRPIENYPPVQNFLNYAAGSDLIEKIFCFTSYGNLPTIDISDKVELRRRSKSTGDKLSLWMGYLNFTWSTLRSLIASKAQEIICYETISLLPVYLYLRLFRSSARVYLHFHEYKTLEEYKNGGALERYLYRAEKYLIKRCVWLSHTNNVRLQKYLRDVELDFDPTVHHELPNYPSKRWSIQNTKWVSGEPLKLVYVGYSLTKDGSYIEELVSHLAQLNLWISLDLYCIQSNDFLDDLIADHSQLNIRLKKAIPYDSLAKVISQYHIGLILYKATTQNYIYNAPNKLFEYLSCGLDVWYPQEMKGIHDYDQADQPKVIRLDFDQLEKYSFEDLIAVTDKQAERHYFAEDVYRKLITAIGEQ